jgi:hypothetical protein
MVVAAMLLAVALSACQQGNPGTSTKSIASASTADSQASTAKPGDYVSTKVFEAREKELQYRFAERLLKSCIASFGSEGEMKSCYRKRVLHAFDDSGLADQHCPAQDDLDGELTCIIGGSIGYQFVHIVAKEKTGEFNWSDPEKTVQEVTMDFVLTELRTCLGGSSASSANDCLTKSFVTRLEIPDTDVQLCLKLENDFKEGQCLGEAYALKFMAAGIEKI